MKRTMSLALSVICLAVASVSAQVRIGGSDDPHLSAVLDLNATDGAMSGTLGLALPRVQLTATDNKAPFAQAPIVGTLVYNTIAVGSGSTAVTPGLYYYYDSKWVRLTSIETDNLDASKITGTLNAERLPTVPVTKGGTGLTTVPQNNVLLGNGTSALTSVVTSELGRVVLNAQNNVAVANLTAANAEHAANATNAEHATNATLADRATALAAPGNITLIGDVSVAVPQTYTSGGDVTLEAKLDIKDGFTPTANPTTGQVLVYDGAKWVAGNISGATTLPYYPTVTDVDGNTYTIGTFGDAGTWMTENLRTTRYTDGDPISQLNPLVRIVLSQITKGTIDDGSALRANPYSANFDHYVLSPSIENSPEYVKELGLLYTWAAANNSKNICPSGWHLPSKEEYDDLKEEIKNKLDTDTYSFANVTTAFVWTGFNANPIPGNLNPIDAQIASIMLSPRDEYPIAIQPDRPNNYVGPNYGNNFTGISKPGREGGFAGKLAGARDLSQTSNVGLLARAGFANMAYFWTSSIGGTNSTAWTFNLICSHDDPSSSDQSTSNLKPEVIVARFYENPKQLMCSVRCKKTDN
ncbi:MAG: hypothetical protein EZS26_002797 [Candidatus Ordinivivax streblomastigis]|uniref:Fibrobacter succinogenes major paralogous domain-containing protein n=1 Tax=Candidatus Ordinivivax streblomastigis TaxID=2540710 RepID=A0A5M8NX86_9BACT|nr:MAG: hypothetical protein EZS26_002797 [Candidatus Ordinivivax streblomastigis]